MADLNCFQTLKRFKKWILRCSHWQLWLRRESQKLLYSHKFCSKQIPAQWVAGILCPWVAQCQEHPAWAVWWLNIIYIYLFINKHGVSVLWGMEPAFFKGDNICDDQFPALKQKLLSQIIYLVRNKPKRSGWFIHSVITAAGHSITTAKNTTGKIRARQHTQNFQLEWGKESMWKVCFIGTKILQDKYK